MAILTITGVITGKPQTKNTSYGQLIKVPIRERNKYYSPYKKYPYYNYFTFITYGERLIRRIAPLEENDIVSFICDVVPKKNGCARQYDFIIMDMSVIQIEKSTNGRMADEYADSFAKSCEANEVDEPSDIIDVVYNNGSNKEVESSHNSSKCEDDIPFD